MIKRKHMVLSIFAFCLTITLCVGLTTSEAVYNPLADVDQDGDVDVGDQRKQQLAMFTYGNPVNITELEARVEALEEEPKVKVMRFVEPDETFIEIQDNMGHTAWENASRVFAWSPMNSSNNVILSIYWWFEYKINATLPDYDHRMYVGLNITCDDSQVLPDAVIYYDMLDLSYQQLRCNYWSVPKANCANYQFWFQIRGADTITGGPPAWKAYVRNLNFVLTVADGLPEHNP